MAEIKRQLVVFDFDWSLADYDSDHYVLEVLAPDLRRHMDTAQKEMVWVDLIAYYLEKLHERGFTREQIENVLINMPFHPAMIRGVSKLKGEGKTTFLCLSDANEVYIGTILKSKGLENLFDEIITNRAEWLENGMLQLRRRVDPEGPQHSCKIGCSPNLCKGDELAAFLKRNEPEFDRIIYVGDGSNDFCPILRLRSQDRVLCRTSRGLQRQIEKRGEKEGLQAQVQYWTWAYEVEEILNTLSI